MTWPLKISEEDALRRIEKLESIITQYSGNHPVSREVREIAESELNFLQSAITEVVIYG